jgi:hypothetical protein
VDPDPGFLVDPDPVILVDLDAEPGFVARKFKNVHLMPNK